MRGLKGLGKPYQIAYSFALALAFVTYFVRRYLPEQNFFYLASASLLVSGILFLTHLFLKGWRIQTMVAGIAVAVFLFLMPYSFYTIERISDFAILSFFLLSVSVDATDRNLMRNLFQVKLLVAVLVFAAYWYKLLPDITAVRQYEGYELTRHSYGFMSPNSLGMYFVSLLLDFSLLHRKRTFSDILLVTTGAFLIYFVTNSRTAALLSIGALLLLVLKPWLMKVKISGSLLLGGLVLIFGVGFLLSYYYNMDNSQYEKLNLLLSNRLRGAHTYIQEYGLSLQPRNIVAVYWKNGTIIHNENFYIDSLLRQGVLVFSLFPILLGVQLFSRKFSLYHGLLFLLCLGSAMMEDYGASFLICSPLLLNYIAYDEREGLKQWHQEQME